VLGWTPQVSLAEGLAATYAWIARQLAERRVTVRDRAPDLWAAPPRLRENVSVALG